MDEAAIRALLEEFGQAWNDHDLDRALEMTTARLRVREHRTGARR